MEFIGSILIGIVVAVLVGVAVYCFMVYFNTEEPKSDRSWTDPSRRHPPS